MTTDRIHTIWPAPRRGDNPEAFKPSRIVELLPANGNWDGDDWIQREGDKIVRYVKPPSINEYYPDLSNCLTIW